MAAYTKKKKKLLQHNFKKNILPKRESKVFYFFYVCIFTHGF